MPHPRRRNFLLGDVGIRWLLRDEFSDTRAAGAVNGTPATPGPGTRMATDLENKLSIAGGNLVLAGGKVAPAWGDPGLWYGAMVRTAGRVVLAKVNATVLATAGPSVGWDANTSGTGSDTLYFSGIVLYGTTGAGYPAVGAIAATTTYVLAAVQRGTGMYYFIRGGGYTAWILVWMHAVAATTPLYPAIISYDAVFTADFIRSPEELWLPTPVAFDSFTRADGALGGSEAVGPDLQGTPARVWVNRVGTTLVVTNVAQASVLDGGIAIATVNTGTVNAITSATLTRAGNEVGVVLRYADADNYIRAIHDGTNCKLVKRVATVETDVISAVVALGAGAIRVIPDGTAFRLYLNNAQVGATSTISDAALQTGTEQGLFSTNVGNTQDLLSIFARGSNGEYAALNTWSF